MIEIGVMQGRLLPPLNGELQAFPGEGWATEFKLARECGFDTIEMIFDLPLLEVNPLNTDNGIEEIRKLSKESGIKVRSICADYFMRKSFLRVSEEERRKSISVLEDLTKRAQSLGARYIVLPFVDQSEIRNEEELEEVKNILTGVIDDTAYSTVEFALEMSLESGKIWDLIKSVNRPRLKVNYDTGNSTSLGYDLAKEIDELAPWIVDVHIKDRKVGGESCLLGAGDTDFEAVFSALSKINFQKLFILQTQRGGNEVETTKRHLKYVKEKISAYYKNEKGVLF